MAKFEVQIFGTVPDCLQIEAASAEEACEKAIDELLDILDFEAAPADEAVADEAVAAEPEQAKCGKARRKHGGNKRSNKG